MAIIQFMGRPTTDPVMQQGKTSGAEYISLDIGVTQRSQDPANPSESIFYKCYFSKHLADRLLKAGVKTGTCLSIVGTVDIHPFLYNKGQKAGQPGVSVNVNVKDWEFCISNRPANGNMAPNGVPGGTMMNNGGAAPSAGNMPNPQMQGGYGNAPGNPPLANGVPASGASMQANAYGTPAQNPATANNMYQQPAYPSPGGIPNNGMMPNAAAGNGFTSVPEGMAGQLPFN